MMGRNSPNVNLSLQRLMQENPQNAHSLSAPSVVRFTILEPTAVRRNANGSQLTGLEQNGYAWAKCWAIIETN